MFYTFRNVIQLINLNLVGHKSLFMLVFTYKHAKYVQLEPCIKLFNVSLSQLGVKNMARYCVFFCFLANVCV